MEIESHVGVDACTAFEQFQLRALARHGSITVLANVAVAAVVATVLSRVVAAVPLWTWFGATLAVALARLALLAACRRPESLSPPALWRRTLICGTCASGLLWGLAGPWVAQSAPLEHQVLIAFAVGGLCAGAGTALTAAWHGYLGYLIVTLVPLAGWFFSLGGEVQHTMAGLIVLYGVVLVVLARSHYHRFRDLVGLGSRHETLLARLRESNRELVETNERLGAEIDERRRAEDGLRSSEGRFRDIAAVAADWCWECDARLRCTGSWGRHLDLLGVDERELIGAALPELIASHAIDLEPAERFRIEMGAEVDIEDVEMRWRRADGAVRVLRISARPVFDHQGRFLGYRGAARDATEQHRLAARLTYQARHDALTGLLSRRELERRLQRVLGETSASEHAVCYLDLDQFKVINDTCGHVAGDELLRQIAAVLSIHVRRRDTIARLGGDEFAVLMEHCPLAQARRVAGELRAAVEELRFKWEDKVFNVAVSIGVVGLAPRRGQTLSDVLRAADAACYAAKEEGRNRIHVYHPDDAELTRRFGEMHWVAEISRALEEDRFELMYQTIEPVDAASGAGRHFEVLVRMRSPGGQIVAPGAFLPAAERYNLAVRVDQWVVEHTLTWLELNPLALSELTLCSLNLSGQSLANERFLATLLARLDRSEVPARKLCFEVTETAAIGNLASATRFVETLRARGCSVALDDFGSGLSSFAYLKGLPVDFLKIDGAFVKDMAVDPIDRAMVKSINEIGHVMGKRTVAEFVEDAAILAHLRELGVDFAQGYGIGRPRPLAELIEPPREAVVQPLRA